MVDVKTAVQRALDFVQELYEGENLRHLALEEIRLSEDEKWWLVTVGFQALAGYERVGPMQSPLLPNRGKAEFVPLPRVLKVVRIDVVTGDPAPELLDRDLSRAG